jgi:hypothetical protein
MDTITTQPAAPRKWNKIWLDVWTNPGTEAFWSIMKEPDHGPVRGFIWIGVTSLIVGLISGIGSFSFLRNSLPEVLNNIILSLGCYVILTPISAIIGMIISTGIFHLIAKLFGGSGKWSDLVFCLAAVMAPATLIGGVISVIWMIFSQVQVLQFLIAIIFGIVGIVLAIYYFVLYIQAIKAVENIGTGGVIVTIFGPAIVVTICILCSSLALIPAFTR